jgi:hypothetical protein
MLGIAGPYDAFSPLIIIGFTPRYCIDQGIFDCTMIENYRTGLL